MLSRSPELRRIPDGVLSFADVYRIHHPELRSKRVLPPVPDKTLSGFRSRLPTIVSTMTAFVPTPGVTDGVAALLVALDNECALTAVREGDVGGRPMTLDAFRKYCVRLKINYSRVNGNRGTRLPLSMDDDSYKFRGIFGIQVTGADAIWASIQYLYDNHPELMQTHGPRPMNVRSMKRDTLDAMGRDRALTVPGSIGYFANFLKKDLFKMTSLEVFRAIGYRSTQPVERKHIPVIATLERKVPTIHKISKILNQHYDT